MGFESTLGPGLAGLRVLWRGYWRASHGGAIFNHGICIETVGMAGDSTTRKDTLKVEKLSLLVLTLCIVVLVYVLVTRPF
jgi:hypothetical protein